MTIAIGSTMLLIGLGLISFGLLLMSAAPSRIGPILAIAGGLVLVLRFTGAIAGEMGVPLPTGVVGGGSTVYQMVTISPSFRTSYYSYDPKPDITAPELAEILKVLVPAFTCHNALGKGCDPTDAIEASPESVKRHFVYHER